MSEPAAGAEALAGGAKAPTAGTEVPAGSSEAPAGSSEAPAGSSEAPAGSSEAPAAGIEAPAGSTEAPARSAVAGPDGLLRCPWALGTVDYIAYHDQEWGQPVRSDAGIFERLSLEAFQSGLSWLTILRKRENFRAAFAGFDPETVAGFGPEDEARLLADAGIVRNRLKIRAVIGNARAALEVPGGLAALVWRYADTQRAAPVTLADVPAQTPASRACARELRKLGFSFVGPVTIYAALQACGVVDDHLVGCFCRGGRHTERVTLGTGS